ncbi:MAG TPA: GMC family oxidoreductase [Longimicrobiales bacterium]|nr:GMC family oxidoreductase [Longimicrobiales bacterium]
MKSGIRNPESRIRRRQDAWDVVIVGSGAGGSMAAHRLVSEHRARVLLLEAGPLWYASEESKMLTWNYDSPRRGAATPDKPFGEFDGCIGGWEIEGEPYTRAEGTRFSWWRARMLGGRTSHWGRISLRFGPDDFRRRTLDGLGDDWPIAYDDIAPYYDDVDRLIGIFGSREGLPNEPDGIFQPPPEPRCYEYLIKDAADRLSITCIPSRLSILTRPLNGRGACHYCSQCGRGCTTMSNFSAPDVLIRPALATGRLTIRSNAMAREVTVDESGRATGVSFIDKTTGADEHVAAPIVILAASAFESVRILLNSKSPRFPDGLANGSGTLGRYITDTTGTGISAFIPKMADMPSHNCDGVGGGHLYMPWWLDNAALDFPRGYHIEIGGGFHMPGYGFMGGIHRYPPGGGWGEQLKRDYRKYFGAYVYFDGRGEMIPNDDTYCELDPTVVDRWGIPVMRFHWKWTDHERNQSRHMQQTFRTIAETMGGEVFSDMPTYEQDYGLADGGVIIHELGGARMGHDSETSALNEWCQAHECPNLFVADGAPFVSQADKNPTWTIMALAMRTADAVARFRREGRP